MPGVSSELAEGITDHSNLLTWPGSQVAHHVRNLNAWS
jgi:hypothetical protein